MGTYNICSYSSVKFKFGSTAEITNCCHATHLHATTSQAGRIVFNLSAISIVPLYSWWNKGQWGGGGLFWQKKTFKILDSQYKTAPSPPAAAAAKASSDFPATIFCPSMSLALIEPQASSLKRVSSFTAIHVWKLLCWFCVLRCIRTHVLLPRLGLTHKHNSSTGVGGNIFFFPAKGCYVWSVWGKCERTKVAGSGHSACKRISSLSSRGKKRGEP